MDRRFFFVLKTSNPVTLEVLGLDSMEVGPCVVDRHLIYGIPGDHLRRLSTPQVVGRKATHRHLVVSIEAVTPGGRHLGIFLRRGGIDARWFLWLGRFDDVGRQARGLDFDFCRVYGPAAGSPIVGVGRELQPHAVAGRGPFQHVLVQIVARLPAVAGTAESGLEDLRQCGTFVGASHDAGTRQSVAIEREDHHGLWQRH